MNSPRIGYKIGYEGIQIQYNIKEMIFKVFYPAFSHTISKAE